jgi:hypothetical protein
MSFEIHVTLDNKYREEEAVIKRCLPDPHYLTWKFSAIDGDPVLGDKVFCYLTGHTDFVKTALHQLVLLLGHLRFHGIEPIRTKIEHIVFDSKTKTTSNEVAAILYDANLRVEHFYPNKGRDMDMPQPAPDKPPLPQPGNNLPPAGVTVEEYHGLVLPVLSRKSLNTPEVQEPPAAKPGLTPQLGDLLRDKLTGFTGVAAYKTLDMNGNIRFALQPRNAEDPNKIEDMLEVDRHMLEVVEPGVAPVMPVDMDSLLCLGDKVQDIASGMKGMVVLSVIYLSGCVHHGVLPKQGKGEVRLGLMPKTTMIPVQRLVLRKPARSDYPTFEEAEAGEGPGGPSEVIPAARVSSQSTFG